jgi:hypothetical protein
LANDQRRGSDASPFLLPLAAWSRFDGSHSISISKVMRVCLLFRRAPRGEISQLPEISAVEITHLRRRGFALHILLRLIWKQNQMIRTGLTLVILSKR